MNATTATTATTAEIEVEAALETARWLIDEAECSVRFATPGECQESDQTAEGWILTEDFGLCYVEAE
jgi:hypothetical protein